MKKLGLLFRLLTKKIMKFFMSRVIWKQFQIFMSIILFIFNTPNRIFNSFMVDYFIRFKKSTYCLFKNQSRIFNISLGRGIRMFRHINIKIIINNSSSAFPKRIFSTRYFRTFFLFIPRFMSFFKSRFRNSSSFNSFKWRGFTFLKNSCALKRAKIIFFNSIQFYKNNFIAYGTFLFQHINLQIKRASFSVAYKKWLNFLTLTKSPILAIKKPLLASICIITLSIFCCQIKSYAAPSNLWPDNDLRVDGSVDTMDEVDTFINTLSEDVHDRLLSTDGETIAFQVDWSAAGRTCADLGTVTTVNIDGGTIDGTNIGASTPGTGAFSNGILLPSGAVFFMITGSCPTGTTDVSATYPDKFLRVNATQGSTGGSDTVTLEVANLPPHSHDITPRSQVAGAGAIQGTDVSGSPLASVATDSTGSGTAFTVTNPYVTCKLCQVN